MGWLETSGGVKFNLALCLALQLSLPMGTDLPDSATSFLQQDLIVVSGNMTQGDWDQEWPEEAASKWDYRARSSADQ